MLSIVCNNVWAFFSQTRYFLILYNNISLSIGLSATTICRLRLPRWEQQEKRDIDQRCSQPPVAAPPPILLFLFLDVLFLLLSHTVSECLSALQTMAPLPSAGSACVCIWLYIALRAPYIKEEAAMRMTLAATVLHTTKSIHKKQQPWSKNCHKIILFELSLHSMLFYLGVVLSNCFYTSLLIPRCFSQTFIEGQPFKWANRLITITNRA